MTTLRKFDSYDDPAIWEEATVLNPEETRDLKIHLTLRLGADLFGQVVQHRRKLGLRTTTAAIEDLLKRALAPGDTVLLRTLAREFRELRQVIVTKPAPKGRRRL